MKPTKEIIEKAARRGALLQNVQLIMWEFVKKRESDESVNWIEYASKIVDVVEGKNDEPELQECAVCHKKSGDVCIRPDWYARNVGNEPDAYHVACDECNYQNSLDI